MQSTNSESVSQISKTSVKREKSENKGRKFYLLKMRFFVAPADSVKRTFVGLAEEDSYSCWIRMKTNKALKHLAMLKTICDKSNFIEFLHVKNLLQNTTDDGSF